MKYETRFRKELIHDDVYLADGVVIRGNVRLGADSSVWFNSVLRGDSEVIEIGERTNIQDLCLVHCDQGKPCRIGNDVTLGHTAIVHGAIIGDRCMIGIRATVLNDAVIGENSLIAAGALIPEGTQIPPNSVVMGIPGKIVRQTTSADTKRIHYAAQHYVEASREFRKHA